MHKVVICSFIVKNVLSFIRFFFLSLSILLSLYLGQFGASIVALCPKNVGLHSNPAFMLCKPEFQPNNTSSTLPSVITNKPLDTVTPLNTSTLVVTPPTISISTIQPPSMLTTSPTKLTNSSIIQSTDKAAIVEAKKGTDEKCFL